MQKAYPKPPCLLAARLLTPDPKKEAVQAHAHL